MTAGHPDMSPYEAQVWTDLEGYWSGEHRRRTLPPKARTAIDAARQRGSQIAGAAGDSLVDWTPKPIKSAGGYLVDRTLEPTVKAVLGLLELLTATVQELTDPAKVLQHHRRNGHALSGLADLSTIDLEELDRFTNRLPLQWRGRGAAQGAAFGALAFIPGPGTALSIGADLLVTHALSVAIATHIAHAYGLDPATDSQRHHLDAMLRRSWFESAPKVGTVKDAASAYKAGAHRVRWSDKFREDHRIAAALETLMKKSGTANHVPVQRVVKSLPAVAVVTSAGLNSQALASLAKNSIRYSLTVHLATKYDLPLPPNLLARPEPALSS